MKVNDTVVCVLLTIGLLVAAGTVGAQGQPAIILPQKSFVFEPAPEGLIIEHTFPVLNNGEGVLEISSAKATCSCTEVEYDRHILPGETGHVKVRFNSDGYGGKEAKVDVRLETNDPRYPVSDLMFKGQVHKLYTISPPIVNLKGATGRVMRKTVIIKPMPDYPFDIMNARAKYGKNLHFTLEKSKEGKQTVYRLNVTFKGEKKGPYFDKIFLTTNSAYRSEIKIGVFAKITG